MVMKTPMIGKNISANLPSSFLLFIRMEEFSSSDEEYFPHKDKKSDSEEISLPKSEVDLSLDNTDLKTRYRACMILSGVGTF